MNYNYSELTFPSSDGVHTIYAEVYTPKHRTAKGIIQLAHGMIDHPGRYLSLASYLTGEGYIFAGHHHLGHGKSVQDKSDFGFFAEEGGIDFIIKDMHTMNRYLRDTYPTLPLVVFGHSMGSFITRLYVLSHPHSMSGVVIHGTGGPNRLLPLGKLLGKVLVGIKGPKANSKLITAVAFGSHNKKFPKSEGRHAWLTRDVAAVSGKDTDPLTDFSFTVSGYVDLFRMLERSNFREWFKEYPKDMPTLIMSGDMDPVGNYGKGPEYVYKQLMVQGCTNVELKLYHGARHELFNETNKEEVFYDLCSWLGGVTE